MSDVKRGHPSWLPDAVIAIGLFIAGATVGGAYRNVFVASGAPEEYGVYREFGAAVALACGRGFVDPGYAPSPAVEDFLLHKRDRITCADLPPNAPRQRPNLSQGLYRYLMSAGALVWVLSGSMSWNGLTPLFAAVYGVTLLAAYGIFRLAIGRVMSVVATVALLVSAVHLGYLPYLRDYSKAPFVLLLILIMARLALRPLTWRRAAGFGVAFGAVLGIGFGFRNDLLISVVPWMAVVLLCLPGPVRANPGKKALCLAASAVAFLVVAWPILTAYSRGSNSGHVAFLGLMNSFDVSLGTAGSIYDWGYHYNDGYANRMVNSFTYRTSGHPVAYLSAEYDRAMLAYILEIVRHWPADFVARAYGSVLKILDLPFAVGAYTNATPYGIRDERVLALYGNQIGLLRVFNGMGLALAVLALLVISARSVRAAVTVLVFLVYFAGYPAIQFSVRHFFHLEFISWWALAFLTDRTAVTLWRRFRRRAAAGDAPEDRRSASTVAARIVGFAAVATVLLVGSLLALRWHQADHVRTLLERSYLGADREPVEVVKTPAADRHVLFDASAVWKTRNTAEDTSTEYIVAEFSPVRCKVVGVVATFRYQATVVDADYSHDVVVRMVDGDQSTLVFFPAFFNATWAQFKGIELADNAADCLASVSRVRKDRVPEVLLDVTFTPHWRRAKLYQTLTTFETPSDGEEMPVVHAQPPTLPVPTASPLAPFVSPRPDAEYLAPIVHKAADASLLIKGTPDTIYSQVMVLKDQPLQAGAIVVARGEVRTGGITLGLIGPRGGAWVTNANVMSPGPFVVAVAVPHDDMYTVTLANCIRTGWIESHLPEKTAEWLLSMPGLRRENDVLVTALGWFPPAASTPMETSR